LERINWLIDFWNCSSASANTSSFTGKQIFTRTENLSFDLKKLFRDTTIQQLTASPALKDGKLVYEDSPLVKACLNGHVLVIDEADKAPTHVTAILRSLLECGHIRLPDGRVISKDDDADIKLHPDFRILALANRPGFPFLGNDFFGACGDSFSW